VKEKFKAHVQLAEKVHQKIVIISYSD